MGAGHDVEQPFHDDLGYYEGRADGIATVKKIGVAEAQRDLAARHGFAGWAALRRHVEGMRDGTVAPTPFVLAYRAIEANDHERIVELVDRFPDLIKICSVLVGERPAGTRSPEQVPVRPGDTVEFLPPFAGG